MHVIKRVANVSKQRHTVRLHYSVPQLPPHFKVVLKVVHCIAREGRVDVAQPGLE